MAAASAFHARGASAEANHASPQGIRAIAFDALVLFDLSPVSRLAEEIFPGKGAELSRDWRTRQFEYAWLRTITGTYLDFWQITGDALIVAAEGLKLDLTSPDRARLLEVYLRLEPWPDVPQAIEALKRAGLKLAILSNFTSGMLQGSGLTRLFDRVLSTDLAMTYKPSPRAYRLAVDALELSPRAILFAAFAPWDAAGAKHFGFPTVWVNRSRAPWDRLGQSPDHISDGLPDLVSFVGA